MTSVPSAALVVSTPSASVAGRDITRLSGHIPALDGLRGLAILLVLARHFTSDVSAAGWMGKAVLRACSLGWLGVDLFFVLSGFLITGILLDARGTPNYFRNFYMRRVLRIFPLYYGVLVVLLLLLPLFISYNTPGLQSALKHQTWLWLYGVNFMGLFGVPAATNELFDTQHFWSLAVEEHFYLVWPTVVFLCGRRSLAWVCGACMVQAVLVRLSIALWGHDVAFYGYVLTPCRMDSLAFGGLLALAVRDDAWRVWLRKWSGAILLIAIVAGGAVLLRPRQSGALDALAEGLKYTLLAMSFGALLLSSVLAPARSPGVRILTTPVMLFLGKYSYGLYVLHGILMPLMDRYASYAALAALLGSPAAGVLARLLIGTGVSVGLAVASWHLYEKHFLKLKRFFEYRRPAAC